MEYIISKKYTKIYTLDINIGKEKVNKNYIKFTTQSFMFINNLQVNGSNTLKKFLFV